MNTTPRYAEAFGRRVTYHSQDETRQDQWVLHKLNGKEHGTFLEVGAYDGVYHSNTLTLERDFGWDGWLVEALPQPAEKARRVRRAPVLEAYFRNPPTMFRLMTVEIGIYGDDLDKLARLLQPLGYRLENVAAWESYWVHPGLCK